MVFRESNRKPGMKILVGGSNQQEAKEIKKILQKKLGTEVEFAHSSNELQKKLASEKFDVITLDLNFEDGCVLEPIGEILKTPEHPEVIVLMKEGNEEVAVRALLDGASFILRRDEHLAELLPEAVGKALEKIEIRRSMEELDLARERFLSIFESIDEIVYVSDPESYEVLFSNRALRDVFGDTHGKKCYKEFQRRSSPCTFCTNDKIFGENLGKTYIWEFQNERNKRWYRCIDKAIRWTDGRFVRYEMAVDITDKKEAEEAVLKEKTFTETALNTISDIFAVLNFDGRFSHWNNRLVEVTGYSAEEIPSLTVKDICPKEDSERLDNLIEMAKGGSPQKIETEIIKKDKTRNPIELSANLIQETLGGPGSIAMLAHDISDRKKTEEALKSVIQETNERRQEISALLECTRYALKNEDFGEAAHEMLGACMNLVEAENGFVSLLDEEYQRMIVTEPEGLMNSFGPKNQMPLSSPFKEALTSRKTTIDNEFRENQKSLILRSHIRIDNVLVAPLIVEENPSGFLCLSNKAKGFSTRDSLMVSAFADIASLALKNSISRQKLMVSEARFRSTVESAFEAIVILNGKGDIAFWNRGAKEMFGYSESEILGKSFVTIFPERLRKTKHDSTTQAMTMEAIENPDRIHEIYGLKKDGREFPIAISRSPWKLDDEVYQTAIIRDTTKRKKAEEALRKSEERYRQLVEAAPDVIYTISEEGIITSLNTAFGRITGWSREEWIGKPHLELVHPDDHEKAMDTFLAATEGKPQKSFELRILSKSGEYLVGEFISVPLVEMGESKGEFGIVRDITERKKAERSLRESTELYMTLVGAIPDAVTVTNLEGKIVHASQRTAEIHGFEDPNELIGMNALEFMEKDDINHATLMIKDTMNKGPQRKQEFAFLKKDGSKFIGEISTSLIHDADGNPTGFVGITRDVTERKREEEELQALNLELEGYAYAVSHDLKGPLSSLLAASGVMKNLTKKSETPDRKSWEIVGEVSEMISESVEKANRLIDELLTLAEAGQQPQSTSEVNIRRLISSIIKEKSFEIESRDIRIVLPDDLGIIRGNETQLYQIFSNLIDNAIKHNDNENPEIRLSYLSRDEKAGHKYLVSDNGPGISERDIEHIFTPFYAGERGETGIGLATVEKLVKLYGGDIRVYNDNGANFEFSLRDFEK
ncbi:MAG: PAS domain S-box protein [Actinomycetota bacterium]|nr:PAS domain S-box protein [Actinomycetota bacterium]